jgi:hypothetical protein
LGLEPREAFVESFAIRFLSLDNIGLVSLWDLDRRDWSSEAKINLVLAITTATDNHVERRFFHTNGGYLGSGPLEYCLMMLFVSLRDMDCQSFCARSNQIISSSGRVSSLGLYMEKPQSGLEKGRDSGIQYTIT